MKSKQQRPEFDRNYGKDVDTSRTKFWIPTEQGREYEGQSNVYAAEGMAGKAQGQNGSVNGNVPAKYGGETNKS